jgi:hypothetical protein
MMICWICSGRTSMFEISEGGLFLMHSDGTRLATEIFHFTRTALTQKSPSTLLPTARLVSF